MATNFYQVGDVIDYTNTGSAILSNAVVVMNDVVGIALDDIAATTGVGPVRITGVFSGLAKVAGVAWNVGDSLDWDASLSAFSKGITTAAGDVTLCAVCIVAAGSGDTTGTALLVPGSGTGI